jgi:hypothetical protein
MIVMDAPRPGGRSERRHPSEWARVQGEAVLIDHGGQWLPGIVLWEYLDTGRPRALVRFESPAGWVLRQLRWIDELRSCGRMMALPLLAVPEHQDEQGDDAQP